MIERQLELDVKSIRTDGGKEFYSLRRYCISRGITVKVTPAHTPQHNARAERMGGAAANLCRAMMLHGGIPQNLWNEAYASAVYVLNRTYNQSIGGIPYNVLNKLMGHTDRVLDVSNLRAYGCRAFVRTINKGPKFEARGWEGKFVGYVPRNRQAYRIFDPQSGKVIVTADVTFDESDFALMGHEAKQTSQSQGDNEELSGSDIDSNVSDDDYVIRNTYDWEPLQINDRLSQSAVDNVDGGTNTDSPQPPPASSTDDFLQQSPPSSVSSEYDPETEGARLLQQFQRAVPEDNNQNLFDELGINTTALDQDQPLPTIKEEVDQIVPRGQTVGTGGQPLELLPPSVDTRRRGRSRTTTSEPTRRSERSTGMNSRYGSNRLGSQSASEANFATMIDKEPFYQALVAGTDVSQLPGQESREPQEHQAHRHSMVLVSSGPTGRSYRCRTRIDKRDGCRWHDQGAR